MIQFTLPKLNESRGFCIIMYSRFLLAFFVLLPLSSECSFFASKFLNFSFIIFTAFFHSFKSSLLLMASAKMLNRSSSPFRHSRRFSSFCSRFDVLNSLINNFCYKVSCSAPKAAKPAEMYDMIGDVVAPAIVLSTVDATKHRTTIRDRQQTFVLSLQLQRVYH